MTWGGEGCADLFSLVLGNGLKLHQDRFRLVVREMFFPEKVIWQGKLPREVAPSLMVCKEHLDNIL